VFLLILKELLFFVAVILIIYGAYRWIRRSINIDGRREELEEAQKHIEATLRIAKTIGKVDAQRLQQARDKIDSIITEGRKN